VRKALLAVSLVALAAAAALGWRLLNSPEPPKPAKPFNGVRGVVTDVVYSQQDPTTGTTLVVRARKAVTRDGKVGRIFRTPLKPEVELTRVTAELLSAAQAPVLRAEAASGRYDPRSGAVALGDVARLAVRDREVRTAEIHLRPDGRAEIPGEYDVFQGNSSLGRGRAYSGPAEQIGVRRR
jgi:hypothetical protein